MSWERLWAQALAQFGAENIELRILIGLGVAFVLLMIVEGLRASFRPATVRHLAPPEPPRMVRALSPAPAPKTATAQPFRARTEITRFTPKHPKPAVNRHKALKPTIRRDRTAMRLPSFTEESHPYTPLSPTR